jgi:Flp pilus assembly protein TadG
MPSSAASESRRDGGQAVVELALCTPLVCLFMLAVVQVGLVVGDHLLAHHAAREAARAAAVSAQPAAAGAAAVARSAPGASVSVASDERTVTATVELVSHTDVPLIGALIPDITITATATMAREPP